MALALEGASFLMRNCDSDVFMARYRTSGRSMLDQLAQYNVESERIVRHANPQSPENAVSVDQIRQSTSMIANMITLLRPFAQPKLASQTFGMFNPSSVINAFLGCIDSLITNYRAIYSLYSGEVLPLNENDRVTVLEVLQRGRITIGNVYIIYVYIAIYFNLL